MPGHTRPVRSQEARDEQTIAIGAALGVFGVVMTVVVVGLALVASIAEIPDVVVESVIGVAALVAGGLAVASIMRSERR